MALLPTLHCTAGLWKLFFLGTGGGRNSKNGEVSEVIGGGFQKQIIRGQGGVNKNRKCCFFLGKMGGEGDVHM